jgi:DDE superfamily endonuclease
MWCIGLMTEEYRRRMYDLLRLYARPLKPEEPVICIDEKSFQLLGHTRNPLPMSQGKPIRVDYEYTRRGTANLFVAVEPKAGNRIVSVTERRTKVDFVAFIEDLVSRTYKTATRIHLVLDNLNTHFRKCFIDILGRTKAARLLRRVKFHYTPIHGSWLNMAEIEIGILARQCLGERIPDQDTLRNQINAWQLDRNEQKKTIEWTFTRQEADLKLSRHYVPKLTG